MVYFKLFFLKLEGLHPLYFLKNLLIWIFSAPKTEKEYVSPRVIINKCPS